MPTLPKRVGVAVDLHGCPNRCRHCYLGSAPNGRLSPDVLRQVAAAFWESARPCERGRYFEQVDVASWYREPDFSDDYRALYELEKELGRREPRRYELLSVWRLARDEGYAAWAREHGPRTCQITFFGMAGNTDYFCRRRGAFADALAATERLLEAGMIPRWQVILTKRGLADLGALLGEARQLDLWRRVAELGGSFDLFCHPPAPDGEAWSLEGIRIEDADLAGIPGELMDATRAHFGGSIDWQTEGQLVAETMAGRSIRPYVPEATWFFVSAAMDMFSNYGELTRAWRLGNLSRDSVADVLEAFEADRPPALRIGFHVPEVELARRYGRKESRHLYSPVDARSRWVRLACEGDEHPI